MLDGLVIRYSMRRFIYREVLRVLLRKGKCQPLYFNELMTGVTFFKLKLYGGRTKMVEIPFKPILSYRPHTQFSVQNFYYPAYTSIISIPISIGMTQELYYSCPAFLYSVHVIVSIIEDLHPIFFFFLILIYVLHQ